MTSCFGETAESFRVLSICERSPWLFAASRSKCFFLLSLLLLPHVMELAFPLEAKWCLLQSLPKFITVLCHRGTAGQR